MQISEGAKRVWDVAIAVTTVILAVIGGGFAGCQYLDGLRKDRVTYSMEYVKRYDSAEFTTAISSYLELMDKVRTEIRGRLTQGGPLTTPVRQRMMLDSVFVVLKQDAAYLRALNTITNFYDEIHTCVTSKICEEPTIQNIFGRDAQRFFAFAHPYLCEQRRTWNDDLLNASAETFFNPEPIQSCQDLAGYFEQ